MEKLILKLNFGHDGGSISITITPQSRVNLTLTRSLFLLNSVNTYVKFNGYKPSVELDIDVSHCSLSFTLGYFLKNLQSHDILRCRDCKAGLLVPLVQKFELDPNFVKLILPRKIIKKNCEGLHALYVMPIYRSILHDFYMFDYFGVPRSSGLISRNEFFRMVHEIKTCHDHYLVNILPNCICHQCTLYRRDRLNQLYNCTYQTPNYGSISNSPFRHLPRIESANVSVKGRPG